MSKEAEKFIEKYTTKDQNDWLIEKKDIIAKFMESYHAEQLLIGGVMPRISHFVSEIGQEYKADDEAVLIEIQDGNLRFYEIGYDFERIYLTPVYVA